MKILTKEEEQAHYNATLQGGLFGGVGGLAAGLAGVALSHRQFPAFRSMTLPFKAFLVTSAATFGAIVSADKASRVFEQNRDPANRYQNRSSLAIEEAKRSEDTLTRLKTWGRENRYGIITASWVASMGIALGLVSRNRFLTSPQKLVQARVYAQGLTVAVLVATAALEIGDANQGRGRWETIQVVDPNDPDHKHLIEKKIHHERYKGEDLWKDMVETEERRLQEREKAVHEHEEQEMKDHKFHGQHDRSNLERSPEEPKDKEKKTKKNEEDLEDEESHEKGKSKFSSEGIAPKKK